MHSDPIRVSPDDYFLTQHHSRSSLPPYSALSTALPSPSWPQLFRVTASNYPAPDLVDRLGHVFEEQSAYHHEGPYDATLPALQNTIYPPVDAVREQDRLSLDGWPLQLTRAHVQDEEDGTGYESDEDAGERGRTVRTITAGPEGGLWTLKELDLEGVSDGKGGLLRRREGRKTKPGVLVMWWRKVTPDGWRKRSKNEEERG